MTNVKDFGSKQCIPVLDQNKLILNVNWVLNEELNNNVKYLQMPSRIREFQRSSIKNAKALEQDFVYFLLIFKSLRQGTFKYNALIVINQVSLLRTGSIWLQKYRLYSVLQMTALYQVAYHYDRYYVTSCWYYSRKKRKH